MEDFDWLENKPWKHVKTVYEDGAKIDAAQKNLHLTAATTTLPAPWTGTATTHRDNHR